MPAVINSHQNINKLPKNNVIYSDIVLFTRGKNVDFVSVIFHRAGEIAIQDGTIPPLLEPPNATAIIDKIFANYDRRLRPLYGGNPVEIFISMGFISISNIIEENMVTISNVYLGTSRSQNYLSHISERTVIRRYKFRDCEDAGVSLARGYNAM